VCIDWDNKMTSSFCKDLVPSTDEDKRLAAALTHQISPCLLDVTPSLPQQVAMCFAYKNVVQPDTPESGIVIADQQGCGKTLTALFVALLYWLRADPGFYKQSGKYTRPADQKVTVMVVLASTLASWAQEVEQLCVPERFISIIVSGQREKDNDARRAAFKHSAIIITTASALETDAFSQTKTPRDPSTSLRSLNGKCSMVFVDEADKIAAETVRFNYARSSSLRDSGFKNELVALLELMEGCNRRVMLTGTPWIANNPQGKFCCLILMCDAYEFLRKLSWRIKDVSDYFWRLSQKDETLIFTFMKHKVIRRLLDDVRRVSDMDTIEVHDHLFTVPMTQAEHVSAAAVEASVSKAMESKIASTNDAREISAELLAQITYLRQLTETNIDLGLALMGVAATAAATERTRPPPLGIPSSVWYSRVDARVDAAKDRAVVAAFDAASAKCPPSNKERAMLATIGEIKRARRFGKTVVFTNFVWTNKRIAGLLQAHHSDVKVFVLESKLKPQARGQLISAFNKHDGAAVLIVNVKVGARGLNLQAARFAIMLSVDFNPATKEQAEARIKRFSSKFKTVYIITLMMPSIHPWILSRIVAGKVYESEKLESRDATRVARMRSTYGNDKDKDPAKVARQFSVDVLEFCTLRESQGNVCDDYDIVPQLLAVLHDSISEPTPAAAASSDDEVSVKVEAAAADPSDSNDDDSSNAGSSVDDDDDALDNEPDSPGESLDAAAACDEAGGNVSEPAAAAAAAAACVEDDFPAPAPKRQRVKAQVQSEEDDIRAALKTLAYKWAAQRQEVDKDGAWPEWDVVPRFCVD
jgi:superfamily II DNA or RNA helicase